MCKLKSAIILNGNGVNDWRTEAHRRWCERHPDKVDEEIERTEKFIENMRKIYVKQGSAGRKTIADAMECFTFRLKILKEWREEQCTKMRSE